MLWQEWLFKSPEPHGHVCSVEGVCWDKHICDLSHDSHKHKQSRSARAGALMAHHPAWVAHLTGGSRSTPTVHPCLVRQGGCGWLTHHEHRTEFMMRPTTPIFIQHGRGASVGLGRERTSQRVACDAGYAMREILTVAVCTHADRAERFALWRLGSWIPGDGHRRR